MRDKETRQANLFEEHPNLTAFLIFLVANILAFWGMRKGGGYEFVLAVLASVIVIGSEIWNISQKGRSQFNLLWNFVPYVGFFMVLLLEHKLVSIEVTFPGKLTVGANVQLAAIGTRLNGSAKNITGAIWESSNANVATVNSDGVVTGLTSGNCEIKVTFDGVTCKPVILNVTAA